MKKIILLATLILCGALQAFSQQRADSITITLARYFSKDIFETNGTPYLKPMVESMNATSNSRFFNTAYVPKKVKKVYFKFGVQTMTGFVPEDMKTYTPVLPSEKLDLNKLAQYVDIENFQVKNIKDTAGLAYYAMKTIFYDAIQQGKITVPEKSATILGSQNATLHLSREALKEVMQTHFVYPLLPEAFRDTLDKIVEQFPENFTLPQGANMNTLFAIIPQLEIGSLYGTELLLRFIPPVYLGENIGDFAFWGIGLKHSISQYFNDYEYDDIYSDTSHIPNRFDAAVQAVYQGTYLKNQVGVTKADLTANANIFDFNLQFSKRFDDIIDIYTAFSLEFLNISSEYIYSLPWETQIQLGLLKIKTDENGNPILDENGWNTFEVSPPEYPGDTQPQKSEVKVSDTNFKWIIGLSKDIGRFSIFADYSISHINIFSAGLSYRF